jgi:diguanylate cyclase (GGDEF)-like protein
MMNLIMGTSRAPSGLRPVAEPVHLETTSGPSRVPARVAGESGHAVSATRVSNGRDGRADPDADETSFAERRMRRLAQTASGLVLGLAALLLARLFVPGAGFVDAVSLVATAGLALVLALLGRVGTAVLHEYAAHEETLTGLLRGLSQALSSDAAISSIVDELRRGAGADHVVVVLLKPAEAIVEATLVSASTSVPMSVTRFPATELDPISTDGSGAVGIGRGGPRQLGRQGLVPRRMQATPMPERHAAGNGSNGGVQGRFGDMSEFSRPAVELVAVPVISERDARADPFARLLPIRDATRISMPEGVSPGLAPLIGLTAARVSDQRSTGEATTRLVGEADLPPADVAIVERLADRVCRAYGLRHVLAAPIRTGGRVVGALVLSRRTETPWSGPTRRLLESATLEVSSALARANAFEAAEVRATTDALTGLPNRAYFEELIGLLGRGRRAGDALGILMIDIDHFKQLNDRHGHAVGDAVLRGVGWTLRATVRAGDVPARYGGDEFVVVLRHAGPERAIEIAERIRLAIRDLDPAAFGIADPVTLSVGVAVATAVPPRALVERADAALYVAKRGGRDRVVIA